MIIAAAASRISFLSTTIPSMIAALSISVAISIAIIVIIGFFTHRTLSIATRKTQFIRLEMQMLNKSSNLEFGTVFLNVAMAKQMLISSIWTHVFLCCCCCTWMVFVNVNDVVSFYVFVFDCHRLESVILTSNAI